jgi:hypothetical protein
VSLKLCSMSLMKMGTRKSCLVSLLSGGAVVGRERGS